MQKFSRNHLSKKCLCNNKTLAHYQSKILIFIYILLYYLNSIILLCLLIFTIALSFLSMYHLSLWKGRLKMCIIYSRYLLVNILTLIIGNISYNCTIWSRRYSWLFDFCLPCFPWSTGKYRRIIEFLLSFFFLLLRKFILIKWNFFQLILLIKFLLIFYINEQLLWNKSGDLILYFKLHFACLFKFFKLKSQHLFLTYLI